MYLEDPNQAEAYITFFPLFSAFLYLYCSSIAWHGWVLLWMAGRKAQRVWFGRGPTIGFTVWVVFFFVGVGIGIYALERVWSTWAFFH
jgi:hypothetical protein